MGIIGRPLLTRRGGCVSADVTSWDLEACLPKRQPKPGKGLDCVLTGILCTLNEFVPVGFHAAEWCAI